MQKTLVPASAIVAKQDMGRIQAVAGNHKEAERGISGGSERGAGVDKGQRKMKEINSSVADGVSTVVAYGFTVLEKDDITIAIDGVVQTSGFVVTGVGVPGGGTVVFATAPANGAQVVLYLDPALKRETDYQQFGDFLVDEVNLDFDRLWLKERVKGGNA